MKRIDARFIARAALIAAFYAVLTIMLAPISYGPIQVRVSEAITILAFFDPAAILGLFIGCALANWYGQYGVIDIFLGSFLTLAAASVTYMISRLFIKKKGILIYIGAAIAFIPVVIFNAFGVAAIIKIASETSVLYWPTVFSVGIGQLIAVYLFGYPLFLVVRRLKIYED